MRTLPPCVNNTEHTSCKCFIFSGLSSEESLAGLHPDLTRRHHESWNTIKRTKRCVDSLSLIWSVSALNECVAGVWGEESVREAHGVFLQGGQQHRLHGKDAPACPESRRRLNVFAQENKRPETWRGCLRLWTWDKLTWITFFLLVSLLF